MKRITGLLVFLLLLCNYVLQAQETITGVVTSAENGEPIPGVSVVVVGTTTGTITNLNGAYSIRVPADTTLLRFSFVGMEEQVVSVANRRTVDIVMESSTIGVDEIVVTAIGITRSEKALGYAVSSISAEQALQKSESDLIRSLQGKMPGVDIRSSSGVPGSATRITLRGVSSFLGENQPLFVVDGLPYSNEQYNTTDQNVGGGAYNTGIATLDPNNIQDISVLKGAAAAALYGSRAKNGVVLITTKSGAAKPSRKGFEVTYSSSVNWENISNLPNYQNTYGNGVDFAYANANGSWGPRFDALDSIPTWPQYLEAFPDDFGDSIPWVAQPDNVANLFKTGLSYENALNITGGSENSAFSLTASVLNNDGYIPNSSFERKNISFGGNTQLENGLRMNANLSYSNSKQIGGIFGNNQAVDDAAASSFARTLWLGRAWNTDLPYTDPETGGPVNWNGNSQYDHPLWSWEHNTVTTDLDRIVAIGGLEYDITDWITASYKVGYNTVFQRRQEVVDKYSRGFAGDGAIIDDDVWAQELESNFLLSFYRELAPDMNMRAVVGHNLNERTEDRQGYFGRGIINPGIYDIDNTETKDAYGGDFEKRRLIGVFGDVTLDYGGYAFLNFSGRNDWSSTLPVDNRSYFYPAVSGSFIFTDAFNIQSSIFSFGKIRAGWGKVGKDADPYSVYQTYAIKGVSSDYPTAYKDQVYPFLGQPAMTTPDISVNPNLVNEEKTEIEVGTYLGFFDNRAVLDFTYYHNQNTDLVFQVTTPASVGYAQRWANIGRMDNKGVEIGLELIPIKRTNGLKWNIYSTFTKNINEVVDIFEGEPEDGSEEFTILYGVFGDPSVAIETGRPYGGFYGDVNPRDGAGNLLIDPGTGLLITPSEQDFYGDPNPDFKMSMIHSFEFKGFIFSFLFDWKQGGDIYSNSIQTLLGRGATKDTEDREHTFIIPGYYGDPNTGQPLKDGEGNQIPNRSQVSMNDLYFGNSFAINGAGEWSVYDGTVYRLREVELGYKLPSKLLNNLPIGSVMISLTGRNLWFYAPNIPEHTNFDPEMNGYGSSNIQGIEYSVAPSVRRYGVNLRVQF